ncbi:MAG: AI-2E family transporter [Capsulimonadaceae bacterium]
MITHEQPESVDRPEQWMRQVGALLLRVALVVFAAYILWRIEGIITDVVVSAILAFALVGPVNRLCRRRVRGLPRHVHRLLVALLIFVGLAIIVGRTAVVLLAPFLDQVHSLKAFVTAHRAAFLAAAASAQTWYQSLSPGVRAFIAHQNPASLIPSPGEWLTQALAGTVKGLAKIIDLVIIPVLAFYFVVDGRSLRNDFLSLVPRRRRRESIALLREASLIMRSFVVAQIWLCIIAGVVVFGFMTALNMPSPLILGLLAGATRAIPIIGPVISGIPIVILAALQPGGFILALKVLVLFSVMHLVESKLIMPMFIGHRIHLHAAVVIIVLLIGYEFFGLLGMFMAAPIAAFGRYLILYYVVNPRLRGQRLARNTNRRPSLIIQA